MRIEFTAMNDAGAAAEFIPVTNENHDQCVTSRSRKFSATSPSTPSRRSDFECCGGFRSTWKPAGACKGGNRSAFALRVRGSLARPARNQVDREEELARSDGAGGDHLEEQTHRLLAGFVKRNVDRRQRRHGEGGHLDVIATDDGAVLWHALA